MSEPDYYQVLGVARTATADAIRLAFHEVARKYHPDRWAHQPDLEQKGAAAQYRRAAEAYRVLMEPAERARYDRGLERGEVRLSPRETAGTRPPPAASMVVKSPKARPFWQKAQEAIKAGDLKAARLNLKLALMNDPGNAAIEARIAEVEALASKG